jgi:uncharacterized protein YggE
MKKVLLGISLLVLLTSACTVNKPAEQVRTITVSGEGSVSVKPDYVFLKFLVKTSDWNVSKAVEKNAQNSNNVINAIKETGVDSNDISTADYRISQDNSKDYPGMYTVYNYINVIIRNVDTAGTIVDVAVKDKIGANGITSFDFGVSDKTTALRQARTLAVQNAQDAAALLAGASGCKVGTVVEITENFTNTSPVMLKSNFTGAGFSTKFEPGTIDVNSNVTIKYNLVQ